MTEVIGQRGNGLELKNNMFNYTQKVIQKLKYFTEGTNGEISGLGKSEFEDNEMISILDVEIFKQKCSGGSTVLDEGAMAQFLNELIIKGEDPAKWNVWWHSHADMDTFWSTTDEGTIEETTTPFLISIVVNKKLNILTRLDVFKPFRFTFRQGLESLAYEKGRDNELHNYCKNRIKQCVEIEKPFWKQKSYEENWKKEGKKKRKQKKGIKDKYRFSTQMKRKKPFRLLAQATSEDKQRGVWRKWGSR